MSEIANTVFKVVYDCPIDIPPALEYDQSLGFTQGIRRLIAHGLIADGVPTDKDGVDMLLKTLQHMDQTSLGDRKNKIEADGVNTSKAVFDGLLDTVKSLANGNPFMRAPDGTPLEPEVASAIVPVVDVTKLGDYEQVAGEMEIGIINENATEFFARMNHRNEDGSLKADD